MKFQKKAAAVSLSASLPPVVSVGMQIDMWPIERPIPYEKNARKWSDRAIATVASSIHEYGFRQPIVVDAQDVIVIGHLRLAAAKSLNLSEVPVHVARDLTPLQIKGLRIADNRTSQEASWDFDLLGAELLDLKALDFDLSLTGFDTGEIDGMLITAGLEEGLTDPDAAPEAPVDPVTVPGDLWLLGGHRVLCGDSTSVDAVSGLLGGDKAAMVFTDIPYNAAFNGRSGDFDVIKNDDLSNDQFEDFVNGFAAVMATLGIQETYQCCDWRLYPLLYRLFGCRSLIVWAKNVFGMGRGYRHQHELIVYNGNFDSTTESDLWEIAKESSKYVHPTQKPVALPERAINNSSKAGDVVLDLFGGSGSTLIACEKTGRVACLMELDPKYVDVIVNRWQSFSGKKATLDGDGRTFDELKAERLAAPIAA